jgi:hypothetical protein
MLRFIRDIMFHKHLFTKIEILQVLCAVSSNRMKIKCHPIIFFVFYYSEDHKLMMLRKSMRLEGKATTTKELEYVGVGGRKNKTLTFIDQPTPITLSDGTVKFVWNGIEKIWEDSVGGWGIQTTMDLRRSFCFPYGGYGPLSDSEYEALVKAGKNSAYYIAIYLYERAGTYSERMKCNRKRNNEPYIYINAHPDEAAKRGFPADCWIGAFVNSANSEDKNDFNCELEVVGSEYADERGYPHCEYYLMVVLSKDVASKTFLRMKYGFDQNTTTKRLGPKKLEPPSGKRKSAKIVKTLLKNSEIQSDLVESRASSSSSSSSTSSSSLPSAGIQNEVVVAAASLVELRGDEQKRRTLHAIQTRLQSTLNDIVPRRMDNISSMSAPVISLVDRNGNFCKPELLEDHYSRASILAMIHTIAETENDLSKIIG